MFTSTCQTLLFIFSTTQNSKIKFPRMPSGAKNRFNMMINSRPKARSPNRNICLHFSLLYRVCWQQQSHRRTNTYRERIIKMSQDSQKIIVVRKAFSVKCFCNLFSFYHVFCNQDTRNCAADFCMRRVPFQLKTASYLDNGFSFLPCLLWYVFWSESCTKMY